MSVDAQEPEGRRRREITELLSGRILDHVRQERLPPGTHLPAQELAALFNVSRSPVNRALALLGQKDLLAHAANRGYFVTAASGRPPEGAGIIGRDALSEVHFRMAEDHRAGRLPTPVTEAWLRQRYDLGRSQIAAVLNRIAREGWAERRPGYGWEFSPMLATPESLEQTYRLRMAVEPAALLEPGYRLDPDLARRLRDVELRLLAGGIESESADALHERGVRFHEAIVGASGNPFFLETVRRINRLRRLLSYRSMLNRARYDQQCREHVEILDLLTAGRNADAAEALRRHLGGTLANFQKIRPILEG